MRLSIWPSPIRSFTDTLEIVRWCDSQGWDGLYFADHFMPDDPDATPLDGPVLECFSTLAALAAATEHLRLGSLVAGNLYRHPAILANQAATIDHVSGGRFALGLGAGWQRNEHAAYGIDLLSVSERLDRFEEAAEVVRSLLRNQRTTFAGRHYQLSDAPCDPAPTGPLPLIIAGKGERRTMRIAARFADEWNGWCTPTEVIAKRDVLRRHCDDVGRDPDSIQVSTQAFVYLSDDQSWLDRHHDAQTGRPRLFGTPAAVADQIVEFAEAGADELIIPDWHLGSVARVIDTLGRLHEIARSVEV